MTKAHQVVTQQDEWGCGVACVASRLGLSYVEARRRLVHVKGIEIDGAPHGLRFAVVRAVLNEGKRPVMWSLRSEVWPSGTVVFLSRQWGRYCDSGHYMLRVSAGWMDPWKNFPSSSRRGGIRRHLPKDTEVTAALVPKPANKPLQRTVASLALRAPSRARR